LKALLERNVKDATFFQQTDAYVLKYAECCTAKHAAKKARGFTSSTLMRKGTRLTRKTATRIRTAALDLEVNRERLIQSIARVELEVMHSELAEAIVEG
jgi:hypothetical protein